MSREQILRRLRLAQATNRLPEAVAPLPEGPRTITLSECIARFSIEARALGIDCFVEPSPAAVKQRLSQVVATRTVLSWNADHLPYGAHGVLNRPLHGDAPRDEQARAEIGVTGCDAAIAETSSIVVFSGPGRSRTVSLLPPVHVALVESRQLCFSLAEVFDTQHARLRASASCTVITGPSRTADIELTLTLGIHGPGRLVVIIGP